MSMTERLFRSVSAVLVLVVALAAATVAFWPLPPR
jgi:hypothetical protein